MAAKSARVMSRTSSRASLRASSPRHTWARRSSQPVRAAPACALDVRRDAVLSAAAALESLERSDEAFSVVMKFGGTSVANAERMRELAKLIKRFPDERPVVTLSAMGKTTNNLLSAGEGALLCESTEDVSALAEYKAVATLALETAEALAVPPELVAPLLDDLRRLLQGVSLMKELTPRTRDYLVSFGERMSVRLFAAYLTSLGLPAQHFDSWDIGFVSTDDFTNGDICPETYPAVNEALAAFAKAQPGVLPVVTGFLARGVETGAITTLGRGGSDLTATVIGAALGVREVQVCCPQRTQQDVRLRWHARTHDLPHGGHRARQRATCAVHLPLLGALTPRLASSWSGVEGCGRRVDRRPAAG